MLAIPDATGAVLIELVGRLCRAVSDQEFDTAALTERGPMGPRTGRPSTAQKRRSGYGMRRSTRLLLWRRIGTTCRQLRHRSLAIRAEVVVILPQTREHRSTLLVGAHFLNVARAGLARCCHGRIWRLLSCGQTADQRECHRTELDVSLHTFLPGCALAVLDRANSPIPLSPRPRLYLHMRAHSVKLRQESGTGCTSAGS
jgi:hypothetical protein